MNIVPEYSDILKVIVRPANTSVNMTIISTRCEKPQYEGLVYSKGAGNDISFIKYITSDGDGYELSGFKYLSIYTFKLFMRCPPVFGRVYASERVYTGGLSEYISSYMVF